MTLAYLDGQPGTCIARFFSCEDGLFTINGNFGRPFSIYGNESELVSLTPKQALHLLAFLEQSKGRLEQLAKEKQQ